MYGANLAIQVAELQVHNGRGSSDLRAHGLSRPGSFGNREEVKWDAGLEAAFQGRRLGTRAVYVAGTRTRTQES